MVSLKNVAGLAGIFYLIIILASVYGHIYVPSRIFVEGNFTATANNILLNEFLFRTCIVAGVVETTVFLLLSCALYRLLKDIDTGHARLLLAFMWLQVPLGLGFAILKLMALIALKNGELPESIMQAGPYGTARMYLDIYRYGSTLLVLFNSLWLFPLGILIIRGQLIPHSLGILMIVAGIGNIFYGLMAVLFPDFSLTPILLFIFFGLAEIPIMFWLLIKGVKDHTLF